MKFNSEPHFVPWMWYIVNHITWYTPNHSRSNWIYIWFKSHIYQPDIPRTSLTKPSQMYDFSHHKCMNLNCAKSWHSFSIDSFTRINHKLEISYSENQKAWVSQAQVFYRTLYNASIEVKTTARTENIVETQSHFYQKCENTENYKHWELLHLSETFLFYTTHTRLENKEVTEPRDSWTSVVPNTRHLSTRTPVYNL